MLKLKEMSNLVDLDLCLACFLLHPESRYSHINQPSYRLSYYTPFDINPRYFGYDIKFSHFSATCKRLAAGWSECFTLPRRFFSCFLTSASHKPEGFRKQLQRIWDSFHTKVPKRNLYLWHVNGYPVSSDPFPWVTLLPGGTRVPGYPFTAVQGDRSSRKGYNPGRVTHSTKKFSKCTRKSEWSL